MSGSGSESLPFDLEYLINWAIEVGRATTSLDHTNAMQKVNHYREQILGACRAPRALSEALNAHPEFQ